MDRKSALVTHERTAWGGNYFDSYTHANMFRSYKPFDFGVKMGQLFSSEIGSDLVNKKFTYFTVAQKNVHMLPGGVDDYTWYLMGDSDVEFRFTELLVGVTDQVGKNNIPFKFALDRDWLSEPAVIKVANSNVPLIRILGQPIQRSANSWEYEGELQTGDPNAWMPAQYLQPGQTAIRITSLVADELNTKFAADQYGEMFKLYNWTANYANKADFTDKFIRTEIEAKKGGRALPSDGYSVAGKSSKGPAVSSGYVYQTSLKDHSGQMISKGTFITAVEARLEERTMYDREMACEWGQLQKTVDRDTGRTIKIPAGWRALSKDGHFMEQNGSITLNDLFEYLNNIFLTRKGFKERKIKIASGEGGIQFLSSLIFAEYSSIVTVDTLFAKKRTDPQGFHENELQYGSQFTKILMTNGIEVEIVYDPMKDNRQMFPELAPGTNRTLESYAMDIFDFGVTDQTPAGLDSANMTMVMQDGVESFFTVCNVYNFETGAEVSGGNVYRLNKESGIYREMSGSLNIWDVSRVGRIELNPLA